MLVEKPLRMEMKTEKYVHKIILVFDRGRLLLNFPTWVIDINLYF